MGDSATKKKVLFVVTKSNFGGAQRYVYDLAKNLPRDRFEPVVVFGHGEAGKAGRLSRLLIDAGVRTIVLPELGRDVKAGSDWRAFRTLLAIFKDEMPDVVHLNSSKAGGLGALAARLTGVPQIIFTIHGLPADERRPLLQTWAIVFTTWLTIMLAHRTITISSSAFERVQKLPLTYRKVVLIFNGIEAPAFETPSSARAALRSIDRTVPERGLLIGTIAELHPNKDLATALDALAQVTDAHFCIIGDGDERAKLVVHAQEKSVQSRVHFLGYVADAATYLRAFDVFLLTSIKEGLPYVLLEAGAACVPIVAVDIPGVRDIILSEFTGVLVAREPEKIAAAINRIQRNPILVHSLTEEMATRIHTTFSLRHMLEKTLALY